MPAVSKAQFRLMKAVKDGKRNVARLSKEQASEFIAGQKMKGLPNRTTKKKRGKK